MMANRLVYLVILTVFQLVFGDGQDSTTVEKGEPVKDSRVATIAPAATSPPVVAEKSVVIPPCYHIMADDESQQGSSRTAAIYGPRRPCYPRPPPPRPIPVPDPVTVPPPPPPPTVTDDSSFTHTLIVVILDESGSMMIQKTEVIDGYNQFLERQKEITSDSARLILLKFSTTVTVAHSALDIRESPSLNTKTYRPHGGTALYDAIDEGVRIAEGAVHPEERVIVLIMTDGEENSSRKATMTSIRKKMKEKEDTGLWTFAYIGQQPEKWAMKMNQNVHNVREYDLANQGQNYEKAAMAVGNFRSKAAPQSANFFQ